MSSLFPDPLRAKRLLPLVSVPALVSVLALVAAAPLHAGELTLTPSLSLREEYNDNVYARSTEQRGDFVTSVAPELGVTKRSERGSASVSAGVKSLFYLRNSDSSGVSYHANGGGSFTATPRLSLSTDLGYLRDASVSSFDAGTSQVISSKAERQNYRLGGRYLVSELASSSLALGYSRDSYDSPDYLDNWRLQGSAGLDYDLGSYLSRTVAAGALSFRRDENDLSRVDSVSATLGATRELSELWRLSLNGGARFSRSEFQLSSEGRGGNDDWGGVGKVGLSYSDQTRSGSLALSHDLSTASGRRSATRVTSVNLSLARKYSPDLSGTLGGGYAWHRAELNQFSELAIDERSRNLSASLQYQISHAPRDLSLEASYSYYHTQYRHLASQVAQNVFMVRLNWRHQMLK